MGLPPTFAVRFFDPSRDVEALADHTIAFTGLKDGLHQFDWLLGQEFFDAAHEEEFDSGEVSATVKLDKNPTLLVASMHLVGTVNTTCDHCGAPLSMPVDGQQRQIFQLHGDTDLDDEELVTLDPKAHSINLTHYLYECLRLALPARRVHIAGQCDPDVDAALGKLTTEHEPAPDPRWEALKQLKNK